MLCRVINVRAAALSTRSIRWAPRVSLAPALAPRRHPRTAGRSSDPLPRSRLLSSGDERSPRMPRSVHPLFSRPCAPPCFLSLPQPPWASQPQASGRLGDETLSRARAHRGSSPSGPRDSLGSTVRGGRRARLGRCALLTSCAASVRLCCSPQKAARAHRGHVQTQCSRALRPRRPGRSKTSSVPGWRRGCTKAAKTVTSTLTQPGRSPSARAMRLMRTRVQVSPFTCRRGRGPAGLTGPNRDSGLLQGYHLVLKPQRSEVGRQRSSCRFSLSKPGTWACIGVPQLRARPRDGQARTVEELTVKSEHYHLVTADSAEPPAPLVGVERADLRQQHVQTLPSPFLASPHRRHQTTTSSATPSPSSPRRSSCTRPPPRP